MESAPQSMNCSRCLYWQRQGDWIGTCQCPSALACNTTTDSQYCCPHFQELE